MSSSPAAVPRTEVLDMLYAALSAEYFLQEAPITNERGDVLTPFNLYDSSVDGLGVEALPWATSLAAERCADWAIDEGSHGKAAEVATDDFLFGVIQPAAERVLALEAPDRKRIFVSLFTALVLDEHEGLSRAQGWDVPAFVEELRRQVGQWLREAHGIDRLDDSPAPWAEVLRVAREVALRWREMASQ